MKKKKAIRELKNAHVAHRRELDGAFFWLMVLSLAVFLLGTFGQITSCEASNTADTALHGVHRNRVEINALKNACEFSE